MYAIKNDQLAVSIQAEGAEITSMVNRHDGREYMWQADPAVWGSSAPVLFPIIGGLKDDRFLFDGKSYTVPKHGFIRRNPNLRVAQPNEHTVVFTYASSPVLKQNYPFDFVFQLTYRLEGRCLYQIHEVSNAGAGPLFFSVGGHPAFKVPHFTGDSYEDYYLDFEQPENSASHVVNEDGLIGSATRTVPWSANRLPLTHGLFAQDALVLKDLKSRSVSLVSKQHGKVLAVHYKDFNYLGIWAKPNGDFVCIEPWLGIADNHDTTDDLTKKEGIIELPAGETFRAEFVVEVF